ncbi:chaplin [Actinacidiphila rubida]|uniref:Small secreted domain n=1 Tax=Actinacidiphila rubida TaxID=310780 RepID=A0A1H8TNE0_9ACTN|nr:chaplin [Actinacidiphila rubida]SEO92570.1 Small secreted domain [Actinacidiphila rubida]
MRQILSRSVLTVAAASGILVAAGGLASADSDADGTAAGSPGLLSGNSVEVPVEVPVNVCGNSVDAAALLDPALGDTCSNGDRVPPVATPPRTAVPPAPVPPHRAAPPKAAPPSLAETGTSGRQFGAAGATSAALLLGGAMLYRRGARPAPALTGARHRGGPAHARH